MPPSIKDASKRASTLQSMPQTVGTSDETSRLLDRQRQHLTINTQANTTRSGHVVALAIMGVILLQRIGDQFMDNPQTRMFEAIICYRHYERADPTKIRLGRDIVGPGAVGGVREAWCKVDEVQTQLADIQAYQQLFDGLPGLVLAVPIGCLMDRFGRKPFLVLALTAGILQTAWIDWVTWWWQYFDLRWTWLSTAFLAIGGNPTMLTSMLFVVLSDVVPSIDRATVFLRAGAASLLPTVIMPLLAAVVMPYSLWIPCFVGLGLETLAVILCLFTPETLGFRDGCSPRVPAPVPKRLHPASVRDGSLLAMIKSLPTRIHASTLFLHHDWRIPALIAPFIAHELVNSAGTTLLQWCSKRYDMTFATATFLVTILQAVKVALLLAVLPAISRLLRRHIRSGGATSARPKTDNHNNDNNDNNTTTSNPQRRSARAADLLLARATAIMMATGWTIIGLAPKPAFAALGMLFAAATTPAFFFIRCVLTSLVPAPQVARVYAVIALFDTLGSMAGGAVVARLFERGMRLATPGLPWFFFGALGLVTAVVLFAIHLQPDECIGPVAQDEVAEAAYADL